MAQADRRPVMHAKYYLFETEYVFVRQRARPLTLEEKDGARSTSAFNKQLVAQGPCFHRNVKTAQVRRDHADGSLHLFYIYMDHELPEYVSRIDCIPEGLRRIAHEA